ncbi:hypothetical protein DIE23_34340, partial [Burkholderia sp. Bp9143]
RNSSPIDDLFFVGPTTCQIKSRLIQLKSGKLQRILPEYRQEANVWAVTAAKLQSSPKLRTCTNFIMKRLRQGPHALDTSIR